MWFELSILWSVLLTEHNKWFPNILYGAPALLYVRSFSTTWNLLYNKTTIQNNINVNWSHYSLWELMLCKMFNTFASMEIIIDFKKDIWIFETVPSLIVVLWQQCSLPSHMPSESWPIRSKKFRARANISLSMQNHPNSLESPVTDQHPLYWGQTQLSLKKKQSDPVVDQAASLHNMHDDNSG